MTAKVTEDAAEMVTELAGAVRDFRQGAEIYRVANRQIDSSSHAKAEAKADSHSPTWIAVICVVSALVWGLAKDGDKAESLIALQAQATRQQSEIMDLRADIRELRATDNAVRAYINTGILKPKPTEKTK